MNMMRIRAKWRSQHQIRSGVYKCWPKIGNAIPIIFMAKTVSSSYLGFISRRRAHKHNIVLLWLNLRGLDGQLGQEWRHEEQYFELEEWVNEESNEKITEIQGRKKISIPTLSNWTQRSCRGMDSWDSSLLAVIPVMEALIGSMPCQSWSGSP